MGPAVQYSLERSLDPLTLEIYRGRDGAYTLYEDDGESSAYQNGAFTETRFEITDTSEALICCIGKGSGSFAGQQSPRTIMLKIHKQPTVSGVYCDDVVVPVVPTAESLTRADSGWSYQAEKHILVIKLKPTSDAGVISVS
jgi:hypothetical protein